MAMTRGDGSIASLEPVASDVASVGVACCHGRGGAYLTSRWRIVGAGKSPSRESAAGAPRVHASSSSHLPLLAPLDLDRFLQGSFSLIFFFLLPFSFSAPQSLIPPPMVTPEPLGVTSNYCASMRIQAWAATVPQILAGPSVGVEVGILRVSGSVPAGKLESKMNGQMIRVGLVTVNSGLG